jgi:hypothetical protein
MKISLFAATALVGVSVFACGSAAQNAFDGAISATQDGASPVVQRQPAFAVRIAGTLRVDTAWVDQDSTFVGGSPTAMTPSFNLFDERRDVAIIGSATADNGLSYGFNYDVDEDRAALYLSNRYGRLDLGNTTTATDTLDVSGSSVMVGRGWWLGGGAKNVNQLIGGVNQVSLNRPAGSPGFSGGGTIRYTTPNYGGLTISISYTEESDGTTNQSNVSNRMVDGNTPSVEDIWSIAGQYTSSYGVYTTSLYAGYERGNRGLKRGVAPAFVGIAPAACPIFVGGMLMPANFCIPALAGVATPLEGQSISVLSLGAKVQGNGVGFAAGYGKIATDIRTRVPFSHPILGDLTAIRPDLDTEWFDVGLSFSSGPWALSAGASHIVKEDSDVAPGDDINAPRVDQEQTSFSLSGQYRLAPGLSISAGVSHWKIRNSDAWAEGLLGVNHPIAAVSNFFCNTLQPSFGNPTCPGSDADNSATTFTVATQMNF